MSLATRCTACGTVFRVVHDQLKVSEGWVRCGRCNEVFNALEGLFDLERDAPAEWPPADTGSTPAPGSAARGETDGDTWSAAADDASLVDRIDEQLLHGRRNAEGSTPATRVNERDRLEFPDARFSAESEPDELEFGNVDSGPPEPLPTQAAASGGAPEFVQHAQRRARWRSPRARAGLALATLLLGVALLLQVAHHFRDVAVARWPALAPAYRVWCNPFGCQVGAPRRIDDISVESTALSRAATADAFRLTVTLRNHGALAVAPPSIDLSLTDAAGQLVGRRVLAPRDFAAGDGPLMPGAEAALQWVLTAGGARVTGYTVEIFYP